MPSASLISCPFIAGHESVDDGDMEVEVDDWVAVMIMLELAAAEDGEVLLIIIDGELLEALVDDGALNIDASTAACTPTLDELPKYCDLK